MLFCKYFLPKTYSCGGDGAPFASWCWLPLRQPYGWPLLFWHFVEQYFANTLLCFSELNAVVELRNVYKSGFLLVWSHVHAWPSQVLSTRDSFPGVGVGGSSGGGWGVHQTGPCPAGLLGCSPRKGVNWRDKWGWLLEKSGLLICANAVFRIKDALPPRVKHLQLSFPPNFYLDLISHR